MADVISYQKFLERKMKKEEAKLVPEQSYKDICDDPDAIERLLRDIFTSNST